MRARSSLLLVLASLAVVACAEDRDPPDAAVVLDGPPCESDVTCDDGDFCNGAERCDPSASGADARGCVAPRRPACFEGQRCDGEARVCVTDCAVTEDADGDGVPAMECGGTDCDDADERRFPGETEVCDLAGHDEDCDEVTFGYRDADGDGFPDARCCNGDRCGTDCDDAMPSVSPTGAELCNERDDDCDQAVDEAAGVPCWPDADNDGYASLGAERGMVCGTCGLGQTSREPVAGAADCDDAAGAVRPGAPDDQCDQLDNDCDVAIDEHHTAAALRPFYDDEDGDGFGDIDDPGTLECAIALPGRSIHPGDCDDAIATTHPGADELCNRLVDDCRDWPAGASSAPARNVEDVDGDGAAAYDATCEGGPRPKIDCRDDDAARTHCDPVSHPLATEAVYRVRLGDLDGDGDLDLAGASTEVVLVWWNDGAGAFTRELVDGEPRSGNEAAIALVDMDGDDDLDVLVYDAGLRWYRRVAGGGWTRELVPASTDGNFLASARPAIDLDGDGLVEIVGGDGASLLIWSRSSGAWASREIHEGTPLARASNPSFVDFGGARGIAIVASLDGRATLFRPPASGTVWQRSELCSSTVRDLDVIDLEPDGDLDLARLGDGTLSLTAGVCTDGGALPWSDRVLNQTSYTGADDLEAADFDGDGDGDVLVAGSRRLLWWENRAGSFQSHMLTPDAPTSPREHLAIGDLDGDGDSDVILARPDRADPADRLVWLEMSGGAFSAPRAAH